MRNKKVYVLRGGGILSQKHAWLHFGQRDDIIIIPLGIINKLYYFDGAKKSYANEFCEYISSLDDKKYTDGVRQSNGTIIKVMSADQISDNVRKSCRDANLQDPSVPETLEICLKEISRVTIMGGKSSDVVLVSQNLPLHAVATGLEITTWHIADLIFPAEKDRYTGKAEANVPKEIVNIIKDHGAIDLRELDFFADDANYPVFSKILSELSPNQYVFLNNYCVARYVKGGTEGISDSGSLVRCMDYVPPRGINGVNNEQKCVLDALFMPAEDAPLVIVNGVAGTGKTYLAIQSGLIQVLDHNAYQKVLICTPTVSGHVSGDESEKYGFLPGDVLDKLSPYFGGIIDNIINHIITGNMKAGGMTLTEARMDAEDKARSYFEDGTVEIQPLALISGHTYENTFIIVDEAQNVHPDYWLDIVTRVGKDSKLVVLGDPDQVKVSSLSRKVNGIVYMMEKWKDDPLAFQMKMNPKSSLRSTLCQRAIEILG